jgi:hypothetical protein
MRKEFQRFLIGFLTFIVGVFGAESYLNYQMHREWQMSQESRLHRELRYLRLSIGEYATAKGELPQSLDDLVKAEYLQEVPVDPVTHQRVWKIVAGNYPNSLNGKQGIVDIHSTSSAISSQGTTYDSW